MASELHRLDRMLRAGTRGFAIFTGEEARAVTLIEDAGAGLRWPVHTWSAATGIDAAGSPSGLGEVLRSLRTSHESGLWILLDPFDALDPATRRSMRELAQRTHGPAIVVVAPPTRAAFGWSEALPELCVVDLPLPSPAELEHRLGEIAVVLERSGYPGARAELPGSALELGRLGHGLTATAFDRLVAEAIVDHGVEPSAIARFLREHKAEAIGAGELLESIDPLPIDDLGGCERLKAWLRRRALALRPEAREASIPAPRGVLLVGVQGCGKSRAARCCGSALGLPVLRLDPGRLFGGTVGASEANLRRALTLAERNAPVVLWLDEVDKGLAGAEGSSSDAGTAARVIGTLLTWLQERTATVFVVATANRVDTLPAELLRKGRLDELFFVDLPDAAQRREILRIHLMAIPARQLGRAPALADPFEAFAIVMDRADGVSGAEIEAAIVEARLDAFAEQRPVAAPDLTRALANAVPLSVTRSEAIEGLRRWARERARPA